MPASMVSMASAANHLDDPDDAAALAHHATALVEAVDATVPGWVVGAVLQRWAEWSGTDRSAVPEALLDAARAAGEEARAVVVPALRQLLDTDVDEQRATPLALLRGVVRYPAAVLAGAGVPPVDRDAEARRLFPDDHYELSPAAFSDIDPSVHEPGLVWGAAKAHVILARRRRTGQR